MDSGHCGKIDRAAVLLRLSGPVLVQPMRGEAYTNDGTRESGCFIIVADDACLISIWRKSGRIVERGLL